MSQPNDKKGNLTFEYRPPKRHSVNTIIHIILGETRFGMNGPAPAGVIPRDTPALCHLYHKKIKKYYQTDVNISIVEERMSYPVNTKGGML